MNFWDIINSISVSYLVLLAFYLIGKSGWKAGSSVFLAVFALVQSSCILNTFLWRFFSVSHEKVPYLFYIADSILYLWGPALYFYILSYTNPGFRLRPKSILNIIPFLTHGIYMVSKYHLYDTSTKTILLEKGLFTHREDLILYALFHLHLLLYLLFSAIRVYEFRKRIKTEIPGVAKHNQRWIVSVLAGFFSVWLFDVSFQTMHVVFAISPFFLLKIIYPLIFILVFNIMLKGLNNPMIFEQQPSFLRGKYFGSNLKTDEKKLIYKNILLVMNNKKLYRDPDLSIANLANELSVLPKHLSQVINEFFNKNFFDFINDYRIREAKSQLAESMQTKKTVLEILYDTGFNSKSSFNKAFRKSTGITPTEYRKKVYSITA